jgi:hypothetical protein
LKCHAHHKAQQFGSVYLIFDFEIPKTTVNAIARTKGSVKNWDFDQVHAEGIKYINSVVYNLNASFPFLFLALGLPHLQQGKYFILGDVHS